MVMRDIDHYTEYIDELVQKREQYKYYCPKWREVDAEIWAVERFVDWLMDEKWKEKKKGEN